MMFKRILWIFAAILSTAVFAQDRIAVAEPVAKGGVSAQDVEAVWGMLEASVDGGYTLISRSALKQMATEIGLTENSGLTELNSTQRAKLGQLKTVKYLLIPTIAKIGSRINFTLMLMDSSTGEIVPGKKTSETVRNLDEFADKLPDMLRELGLARPPAKRGISAMLATRLTVPAPPYAAGDLTNALEDALIYNKVRLSNLQDISGILKKNGIDPLFEAEPAMYARIGKLLRVDNLLQSTITRFEIVSKREWIAVTRSYAVRRIGYLEGKTKIISAQTGEIVESFQFGTVVKFDELNNVDTDDWTPVDYGKYLIKAVIPQIADKVIPKLK